MHTRMRILTDCRVGGGGGGGGGVPGNALVVTIALITCSRINYTILKSTILSFNIIPVWKEHKHSDMTCVWSNVRNNKTWYAGIVQMCGKYGKICVSATFLQYRAHITTLSARWYMCHENTIFHSSLKIH